tara:strand:- start:1097 stop:1426 length:330 start_codon:yes stop_codon:yes gene_type:complete
MGIEDGIPRSPYEPRLPPKLPLKQRPALSPYGNKKRKVYPPMETKTPIQEYCGDDKRKAAMLDIATRITVALVAHEGMIRTMKDTAEEVVLLADNIVNKIDKIAVVDNL